MKTTSLANILNGCVPLFVFIQGIAVLNAQEILTSFTTNDPYKAYVHFAVNNTHFLANDEMGNVYAVFVDSARQLTVFTRTGGIWLRQVVAAALPSETFRSPAIQFYQGRLHLAWLVLTSGSSAMHYARGEPVSTGTYRWEVSSFAEAPIKGAKYLTMTVPDSAFSPLMGFTEPDDSRARLFHESSECSFSPLNSGLGAWMRSSDISVASDSNIIAVAWEEEWDVARPRTRLVFTISYDGGNTWFPTQNVLADGPTLGGDPCVAVADSLVYIAYHRPLIPNGSDIMVARKLPASAQFELLDFGNGELGKVSKGWLPNLASNPSVPGRIAVSWERTDGAYFDKWEHQVGMAWIADAGMPQPQLMLGPETTSPPDDTAVYDLNSNVVIAPDGRTVSWVWVNVVETSPTKAILTLFYKEKEFSVPTLTGEGQAGQQLYVYPNPTQGPLVFSQPQTGIRIYNTSGKLIYSMEGEATAIDVEWLPAGLYYVKTLTGQGKFVKRD
ncbi:MAG: T9SS type A sorting domain-containing protein [Saprospiraceae bacterium]|nr:T9SS type A sorting domain-containing protein [Saprospiraceae bacterium]